MEAIARKRFIRQSPYKIRYVLKTIKGLSVGAAINKLSLTNKKASIYIEEVLKASISNMSDKNNSENSDNLFIKTAYVDEGPVMKRFRPAAMGRATGIRKRTSHLTIIISNKE
jgi:large subunit ribosomal protein L22